MKKTADRIRAGYVFVHVTLLLLIVHQNIIAGVNTSITLQNDMVECVSVFKISAGTRSLLKTDLQKLSLDHYGNYFSSLLAQISQTALLKNYSYNADIYAVSEFIEITLTYTLSDHLISSNNIILIRLPDFTWFFQYYGESASDISYELELPGYDFFKNSNDSPWSQVSMTVTSKNKFSYTENSHPDLKKTIDHNSNTTIVTEEWLVFIRRER